MKFRRLLFFVVLSYGLLTEIRSTQGADPCKSSDQLVRTTAQQVGLPDDAIEPALLVLRYRREVESILLEQRTRYLAAFQSEFRRSAQLRWGGRQSPFRKSYDQVLDFFSSPKQVYRRLEELQAEVWTLSKTRQISAADALEAVLTRRENQAGFRPTIDMASRQVSRDDFRRDFIDQRRLFRDPYFPSSQVPHGSQSHRIQWNLLIRDMEARPKLYRLPDGTTPSASDLFEAMGKHYEITNTDLPDKTIWDALFDSLDSNFANAEFLQTRRRYFPLLGAWE